MPAVVPIHLEVVVVVWYVTVLKCLKNGELAKL